MTLCTACALTPPTVYCPTQLGSAQAAVTSSRWRARRTSPPRPCRPQSPSGTAAPLSWRAGRLPSCVLGLWIVLPAFPSTVANGRCAGPLPGVCEMFTDRADREHPLGRVMRTDGPGQPGSPRLGGEGTDLHGEDRSSRAVGPRGRVRRGPAHH
jgi:hypothetical protein